MSSEDGLNWTPKYPGIPLNTGIKLWLSAIVYGGGRFVAVGPQLDSADVAVSADGENWTVIQVSEPLRGIGYGNGSFVAVGPAGRILTSLDGFAWTRRESGTTNSLRACAYLNQRFVAVGELGTILTSVDAVAWARSESGTTNWLGGAAFGNGAYVVVGERGLILRSADEVNWTKASPVTTGGLNDVAFGNDTFVAVGEIDVLCSSDGLSWTRVISQPGPGLASSYYNSVAYGDGRFVVAGQSILRANVAQAVLSQPKLATGAFEFLISGEKGRTYRLQAATRLSPPDWADLGFITNSAVAVPFADTNAGVFPYRFYRALLNP